MKKNMYSSSSPSHDYSFNQKPKTNNQSLQKTRFPSFSFVESSTTNDAGKENPEKKIIWRFSYFVAHNHNDVVKQKKPSCDVCNKVFTSNKALNGHMKCHCRQNGPTVAAPSFEKQQPCRRRRYMNIDDDDDDVIETVAEILLQLSRMGYEDVNHRGAKRKKLSCNMMDDNEKKKRKKKEQGVLLTSGGHDIEEKKTINEGETELGSKVVKNVELNELPSDDNEGETELGSKVVKNFDLNELTSDDNEGETELESKVVKNLDLNELPNDDKLPSDDNEGETELGSKVVKNFDLNELPSDEFDDETN